MSLETPPALKVQNVVATVKVATELNLDELVGRIPGAEYNKKKFPGLVLRLSSPKVAALVFSPGKIVLTGMAHPDVLPAAFSSVIQALRAAGAEVDPLAVPQIVNLVASGPLGEGVALQRLAVAMNLEHIEYEPEVFPGLVYRVEDPKAVALVFGSGVVVVTGTTNEADAARVLAQVRHVIDQADAWVP
jgi:transcription initiation factor TFIID TATA-box-binding protein